MDVFTSMWFRVFNAQSSSAGPEARPPFGVEAFEVPASPALEPSIARNVMLATAMLVALSFGGLGFWVANKIEESAKLDVGLRAARYMETALSGHLQSLAYAPELAPGAVQALSDILAKDGNRLDVHETRIWSLDGRVLFAEPPDSVGESYQLTDDFRAAVRGDISVDFEQHPHMAPNGELSEIVHPLQFEIYSPIFNSATGEVLAVAEFYQNGERVIAEIESARRETWIVTSIVGFALMACIGFVVVVGTRLIESQRAALDRQVEKLFLVLGQNEDLRSRLVKATQRGTEDHEAILRRIGSDLHDGAGQLITIVLLRLQKLFGATEHHSAEYTTVRTILTDCMSEIRHMAAGLALPEIKSLGLAAAVRSVVSRHEYRSGTTVELTLTDVPEEPSHPVRLGICRMIQEGLNNAFKHADGVGQSVRVLCGATHIAVVVHDKGPGIRVKVGREKRETLGLVGLRNRLESLGAELSVRSDPSSGTTLFAEFPLQWERLNLD